MKTITKTKSRVAFLLNCLFLIFASNAYAAESYSVKPLGDFLQTYKDKHRIILSDIEASQLPLAEKLVKYEQEMSKLKNEFRTARKAEYESKSVVLSVEKSCTKGNSGGVKDCGWASVYAPNSDMYTRTDWIRVEGTNKGTGVSADGGFASLRMTRASAGRNAGTLFATFRYKPASVATLIDKETTDLFTQVVKLG